jgi:hypothetical protein
MIQNNIFEPNEHFDFSKLSLGHPSTIQGGSYFTKILYNKQSLYIQTPKGYTRGGFVKNGKKIHVDLMFDNNDKDFITWLEKLESHCQQLIFEKGDSWFENKLEKIDIENAFTSPMKIYRSGQNYLVRASVRTNSVSNTPNVKIYNENETILTIEDVSNETNVVSIIEILGIKFTPRNFQIDIELKQSMVTNTDDLFTNCLIRPKKNVDFQTTETDMVDVEQPDTTEQDINPDMNFLETLSNSIINETELEKHGDVVELDIASLDIDNETDDLKEFDFDTSINDLEIVSLKKPNQVYYDLYKNARKKAKEMKAQCITAFLEAKNIKNTYMLDDDESDSDDDMEFEEYEE